MRTFYAALGQSIYIKIFHRFQYWIVLNILNIKYNSIASFVSSLCTFFKYSYLILETVENICS